jgi:hypothetical protein
MKKENTKLYDLLQERSLNMSLFARNLGIPLRTFQAHLYGRSTPSAAIQALYKKALGVDVFNDEESEWK